MGYRPWGHKESDTTERLHFQFQRMFPGYSLHTSHLLLPPPYLCHVHKSGPYVCVSTAALANRFISTIFLDSIYLC